MSVELRPYQADLIGQARGLMRSHRRVLCVLPCGGGKTLIFAWMCKAHLDKSPANRVWFLVHRRELMAQAKATLEAVGVDMPRAMVGMVGMVARRVGSLPKPTLIVMDEAAHAAARTWRRVMDAFPDVPTIGLTATPCRLDGKPLGGAFDAMAVGVGARWLIERGYLAPFDYYAPKLDIESAKWQTKGADYDGAQVGRVMDERKVYGDVLKYLDPAHKTICYCPSLAFSRTLADRINARWPGIAAHFDGDTPEAERDRIVKDFREGRLRVLCNVDLIGEGFDVPDCDRAMLLRPTMSVALYVQQAMRCMRRKEGKRAAVYDFVGNAYRHGLPDEEREWSLDAPAKARNREGEPEVLVRECKACFRVYKGIGRVCPYCGHDNGKTRREMEQDRAAELERIEAMERKRERREVGMARTMGELIAIGKRRGYKNPAYWAASVMRARNGRQ